ncbi:hypothetical protein [Phenylobacterium sp. LH3H17]|nr:hypothetical protein [Phenylobacterium sp. LH3H17]
MRLVYLAAAAMIAMSAFAALGASLAVAGPMQAMSLGFYAA